MEKIIIIGILLSCLISNSFSQDTQSLSASKTSFYLGYDLGEMALNKFQNFAGEAGLKLKNGHSLRFVYLNVKLTEEHLSSDWIGAVGGDDVKGLWNGYELLYDLPLYRFKKRNNFIYGGLSVGYHKNNYQHSILDESLDHKTATVGFNFGYRETNIFNVKGLYFNFQVPFRYYFKKLEETKLGSTTVNKVVIEQTISFFIGYEF